MRPRFRPSFKFHQIPFAQDKVGEMSIVAIGAQLPQEALRSVCTFHLVYNLCSIGRQGSTATEHVTIKTLRGALLMKRHPISPRNKVREKFFSFNDLHIP